MTDNNLITETVMRSSMHIRDEYDRKVFLMPNDILVPVCITEEDEESMKLSYDITDLEPFETIRELPPYRRYKLLLSIFPLVRGLKDYEFTIDPDNLYFDMNDRVRVLRRDIKEVRITNEEYNRIDEDGFVHEICSLIAASLQEKYTYEDILKGGEDLIDSEESYRELFDCTTCDELKQLIRDRYDGEKEREERTQINVTRKWYLALRIFFAAGIAALLVLTILLLIYKIHEAPFLKAMVRGEEAYIAGDYPGTIEAMKNIAVDRMDMNQKYILAVSYIKMESLTDRQKDNIIADMPRNSDELLMEYWIYVGRKDAERAENAAMQEADDELLLYAYMLDYENIQIDKRMNGEEKAERMEELTTKINELAKPYLDAKKEEENELIKEQEEQAKSIVETRLDTLEEQIKEQQKQIEENKILRNEGVKPEEEDQ